MSKETVKFEIEKETKNSVRYKEVPEEGKAPIVGSLYVQKWFAGTSKNIEVSIEKKDWFLFSGFLYSPLYSSFMIKMAQSGNNETYAQSPRSFTRAFIWAY